MLASIFGFDHVGLAMMNLQAAWLLARELVCGVMVGL